MTLRTPLGRRVLFAILLFTLAAEAICIAQTTSGDISEATPEELGKIEVYAASRHNQPAAEAPSSVTVITADDIQRYGYRSLSDILNTVRGFYLMYDRNYSYVGVQGFSRPGDYNTRILLLVDGHRLNDNVYDQAAVGTEFPIDIDLIERVEVIRGAVSSLYGSNALFAVLNIITKHGNDVNGMELSADAGSFNSYHERATYGGSVKGLEFLLSGSFYGSRGHKRLFYPEYNTPETNNGIAVGADDDRLGSGLATLSFHDFTFQAVYGSREKGIPTAVYETVFNNPGTRTVDSHGYVDLRYTHTLPHSWQLLARGFYDRYLYDGSYMYEGGPTGSALLRNRDFADGEWLGTEVQLSKTVLRRHALTVGGEFRWNLRQNQTSYYQAPYEPLLNDWRASKVAAGFVQDEIALNKVLSLNAGLRYDYYSHRASNVSPRVALVYNPRPNSTLKFIYAQSFRVPNVYEMYYSVAPNFANPWLKPETIRTVEVSWEQGLGRHLWMTLFGFCNGISDLITQESAEGDSMIFRNLHTARSSGIEAEVKARFFHGFEADASYSLQRAKQSGSDTLLNNSPKNLVKLNLTTPMLRNRLLASMDAQYTGRMQTITGGSVPSFTLVNFTLLAHNLSRRVDLSGSIYNLLNTTYYAPPSDAVSLGAIQQDGRSFRVKLTMHFGTR